MHFYDPVLIEAPMSVKNNFRQQQNRTWSRIDSSIPFPIKVKTNSRFNDRSSWILIFSLTSCCSPWRCQGEKGKERVKSIWVHMSAKDFSFALRECWQSVLSYSQWCQRQYRRLWSWETLSTYLLNWDHLKAPETCLFVVSGSGTRIQTNLRTDCQAPASELRQQRNPLNFTSLSSIPHFAVIFWGCLIADIGRHDNWGTVSLDDNLTNVFSIFLSRSSGLFAFSLIRQWGYLSTRKLF